MHEFIPIQLSLFIRFMDTMLYDIPSANVDRLIYIGLILKTIFSGSNSNSKYKIFHCASIKHKLSKYYKLNFYVHILMQLLIIPKIGITNKY